MKAQLFSIELVITLFVFLGLLYTAEDTWAQMFTASTLPGEMHSEAVMLSQLLLSSAGEPVDWNTGDVVTIGLSHQRNQLVQEKIENLINLSASDYEKAKEVLGTEHDFYFAVFDSDETVLFETENKLIGYPIVSSVKRHCMLEDEAVRVILALGEKE